MRVRPQIPHERFPFLGYIPLNEAKMVVGGVLRIVSIEEYRDFVRVIWRFFLERDRFAEAYDGVIKEERERLDVSTPEKWEVDLAVQGQDWAVNTIVQGSLALADNLDTPYTQERGMCEMSNSRHLDEVRGRIEFVPPLAEGVKEVRVMGLGETFHATID